MAQSDTERSEDEESEIDDLTADLTKVRGKAQVEKRKMKKRDFFDSKILKESNEKYFNLFEKNSVNDTNGKLLEVS